MVTCLILLALGSVRQQPAPLVVPAFTAYGIPDRERIHIDASGIHDWTNANETFEWHGRLSTGTLIPTLNLRLPEGQTAQLRLSIGKRFAESQIENDKFQADDRPYGVSTMTVTGRGDELIPIKFDSVEIPDAGYQTIAVQGIFASGSRYPDIESLKLEGNAALGAQFNLKERRNAASVHLTYPVDKNAQIAWFYNEVTPRADPLYTYYMACGFSRGYFGMQVNSRFERRIIFSVWDSGAGDDPAMRAPSDKTRLIAKGDGVVAGDFGNEGTGQHSHLVYPWVKDTTYRFLVGAKIDGDGTIYTGYFFDPTQNKWLLIASFRAPKDGKLLRGLYSFDEDFSGDNGDLQRKAEFGNGWIGNPDNRWLELIQAKFSHDATGKADRLDYEAKALETTFELATGGYPDGPNTDSGAILIRPAGGQQPKDLQLPPLPPSPGHG